MSVTIRPEARIFHIAPECYIIYLGNEQDDYLPFLRIGNARKLTEEIHNVVEYVVIADNHVGNPLLEIVNCQTFQGSYMGDSAIVAGMRSFFESFNLPSDEITDYRDIQPKEERDTVWFYKSGNIHVRFEGKEIFDLHERSRRDGHFLTVYESARAEFTKNPFRYIRQDFEGNGIISIDGNIFWYGSGELISLSLQPGFAYSLMQCGIDPDLITAMANDLTNDDIVSAEAEAEVRLLKRTWQRRKTLRLITSKPEIQKHLQLVFRSNKEGPPALDVVVIAENSNARFQDSYIGLKNDGWSIKQSDKHEIVFFDNTDNGLSVDSSGEKLTWNDGKKEVSIRLPNGFPVEIIGSGASLLRLVEKYLLSMFNSLKPLIRNPESSAFIAVNEYIQLLLSGNSENDESFVLIAQNVIGALKRCGNTISELSWFYFSNTQAFLSIASRTFPEEQGIRDIIISLDNILNHTQHPKPGLPFFADLYFGKNGVLVFWRMIRKNSSAQDIAVAGNAIRHIAEISTPDPSPWKADYERLIKLIRSLSKGKSGPLSAEQLALLGVSKTQNKKQKPSVSSQMTAPTSKPSISEKKVTEQQTKEAEPPKPVPSPIPVSKKTTYVSPRRMLVPLAAGLLALIIGCLAWDITGKAPWGRILPHRTKTSAEIVKKIESKEETEKSGNSDLNKENSPISTNNKDNVEHIADESQLNDELSDKAVDDNNTTSANESENTSLKNNLETEAGENTSGSDNVSGLEKSSVTGLNSNQNEIQGPVGEEAVLSSSDNSVSDTVEIPEDVNEGSEPTAGYAEGQTDESSGGNVITDNVVIPVDVNKAPKTTELTNAYLNVNNRITISEADIHLTANEIAVINGYKDLDYRVFTGDDPDWIYPGKNLTLPNKDDYTIQKGDTIWFLAARTVRIDTEEKLKAYDRAVSIINSSSTQNAERNKAFIEMEEIVKKCRTEELRQMAAEVLQRR